MAEQPPSTIPSAHNQNELPPYGTGVWISYQIGIGTRLELSFRTVAQFLGIMSRPSQNIFEEFRGLKEEKTGFSDVVAFYYFLCNLYKSAATCSIDRDRWKITKISTYKATCGFKHESLVAEVMYERATVYLRLERRRSNLSESKASTAGKSSDITHQNTQTTNDWDPSLNTAVDPSETVYPTATSSLSKTAHDAITFSQAVGGLVKDSEECVDVTRFSAGKGLSLSQIAVLACCVNKLGQKYSLLDKNCYWFAHLVVETAKLVETDFTSEASMSKTKAGEWQSYLPQLKPGPELIAEAKNLYDQKWVEFNDDIYNSINNENSEIYQKALQREEEERRKREKAERHAAEAERYAAEAKRHAAEQEEEIKKLRAQLAAAQAGANNNSL